MKKFYCLCALLFSTYFLQAQSGSLDTSFGNEGEVIIPISASSTDLGRDVALQPDGKIVVVGSSNSGNRNDYAITRLNPDGSLDNAFGTDGKVVIPVGKGDHFADKVIIQTDGEILVAGGMSENYNPENTIAIIRLQTDGNLDTSFGDNGQVTVAASGDYLSSSIALQPDGKIVVAGDYSDSFSISRLNNDGSLDTTYGENGNVLQPFYFEENSVQGGLTCIAIQPDGKLIAVAEALYLGDGSMGVFYLLMRINTDGSLDGSFGWDGRVFTRVFSHSEEFEYNDPSSDIPTDIKVQEDGKILVAGYFQHYNSDDYSDSEFYITLIRLNPNGSGDTSFSEDGKFLGPINPYLRNSKISDIAIQKNGKLIVAGGYNTTIKLNGEGTYDTDFDQDGILEQSGNIVLQPDNQLVMVGTATGTAGDQDFLVRRFVNTIETSIDYQDATANYGDAPFNMAATSNSGGAITYSITSGNAATIDANTGELTILGAGTVTILAAQAAWGGYLSATKSATLSINKAQLTATAVNKTKTYGEENPPLTIAYSGFVNGDDASDISELTISTTANATSMVGTYPISLSESAVANYDITLTNATLTINKAPLTATAENKTKTYGGQNPPLTIAYSGFVNEDDASDITKPKISTTANARSNVGTYPISLGESSGANYDITLINATLTIIKAPLTATAQNKTKTYGEQNPPLTISYSGFVNGDDAADISELTISTPANARSNAGTYTITLSASSVANYVMTLTNATLTINKAPLTATAENKTKMYGEQNPPLAISYSGFVNGDDAADISALTISTTANARSNAGTYPITLGASSVANYVITLANATLTVNKAPLTATAENKARTYGEQNPPLTIAYSGFVNGDDASNITAPTISTTANAESNAGTYTINLQKGSAINYKLTLVEGNFIVAKAPQLITFTTLGDKTFGDNPFSLIAISSSGLVVNFEIVSGPAIVSGNTLAITEVGVITVRAFQEGDGNYEEALSIGHSFCAKPPKPTITSQNDGNSQLLVSSSSIGNQWLKSGMEIEGATGQNLVVPSTGLYSVRVSMNGCSNESDVTGLVTGAAGSVEMSAKVTLHPNPTAGQLKITADGYPTAKAIATIYTVQGIKIDSKPFTKQSDILHTEFDVRNYPSGIYMVLIQSKNQSFVKKFQKE